MVNFGGVLVDGGSGLRAQVAIARIEVEGAHMVGAVGAGKLHAALDARDAVEAFHNSECSPLAGKRKTRGVGSEGNEGEPRRRSELGSAFVLEPIPCLEPDPFIICCHCCSNVILSP
jgi:hypothetical protein